jgi:hypothetical protein
VKVFKKTTFCALKLKFAHRPKAKRFFANATEANELNQPTFVVDSYCYFHVAENQLGSLLLNHRCVKFPNLEDF